MPLTDTDAAVIGRDDQDYGDPGRFDGDDLEFPSSPDDYVDESPSAKHTDFTGSGQTVDGVKFDFGGVLKGISDGVSSTAKAVAEVAKAKAAADAASERGDIGGDKPRESTPKESGSPKESQKPSIPATPTQPAPAPSGSRSAGIVLLAMGGLTGLATVFAVAASRKKRRRAAEVI